MLILPGLMKKIVKQCNLWETKILTNPSLSIETEMVKGTVCFQTSCKNRHE